MRESWTLQQKKLDLTIDRSKVENKQFIANEKGIVYQRKQMFVCAKMLETKTIIETSQKCLKRGPACFDRMDRSLQLLRKEMVSPIDSQNVISTLCVAMSHLPIYKDGIA